MLLKMRSYWPAWIATWYSFISMMQLGHTNQSVPLLRPHLLSISGLYISRNPTHLARAWKRLAVLAACSSIA